MTEHKTRKEHQHNIIRSSYMKFYAICEKMASDRWTDGWIHRRMGGRTDRQSGSYMLTIWGA